jgi:hypothetical protein
MKTWCMILELVVSVPQRPSVYRASTGKGMCVGVSILELVIDIHRDELVVSVPQRPSVYCALTGMAAGGVLDRLLTF